MKQLTRTELELIFDYCLGVATQEQLEQCRDLIATNPEAADFYNKVESSTGPLNEWTVGPCPDDLVAKTISRVNEVAHESQANLQQLLAVEEAKSDTPKIRYIGFAKRLAMAAVFMVVGSIAIMAFNSASNYARFKSQQTICQAQFANIGGAVSNYMSDHDGRLPSVASAAGSPWWKLGNKGANNESNTRNIWLLVKGNYVNADDFVCPGSSHGKGREKLTAETISYLNDFPDRQFIQYSFQLICDKSRKINNAGSCVIAADLNPLFEQLPSDYNSSLKLRLTEKLMTVNSLNHNLKGPYG